jgi:ABC-2 type transport system ATP-binding protein
MTILLTTHYLDEAKRLCDRVAIMHMGEIVALDTPDGLLADLGSEILELRIDGDPAGALAMLRARRMADAHAFVVGSTLTLPLHGVTAGEVIGAIHDIGLPASGITTRPPTLDDVYLHFTGAAIAAAA